MFRIALYEPEIPPNTGNIIRLCANAGVELHLIEPLGFTLDDTNLRRAGLDYRDLTRVHRHANWAQFKAATAAGSVTSSLVASSTAPSGTSRAVANPRPSLWAFSTRGTNPYHKACFHAGDILLFGPESRGLPDHLLEEFGAERVLRLPMQAGSRSLNLSNCVAVALYEALRQNQFAGLA